MIALLVAAPTAACVDEPITEDLTNAPVATTAPTTAPPPTPPPDPADVGWEGPTFVGAVGSPSGSKPQSKLWFNDGSWWGVLWDAAGPGFAIHRLDLATRRWVVTDTRVDERRDSRADVLWDGTHLYVASHAYAEGPVADRATPVAVLHRYRYDPATDAHLPDAGFPVQINQDRTEALVIDRDSVGRIWATWVSGLRVLVAVSTPDGRSFGPPLAMPGDAGNVTEDDISSVVAFGGDRIGVMWTNQRTGAITFAHRADAAPPGAWDAVEVAAAGPGLVDDHLNLKAVPDQPGRVLAATKTSLTGDQPLVHLLDRDPATGTWSSHVYGVGTDDQTRPLVLVDRGHRTAHVVATEGGSGGPIGAKRAPLDALAFPPGPGEVLMLDDDRPDLNNPTSTKQPLDASTGLVVVATDDTTRRYWTAYRPLP